MHPTCEQLRARYARQLNNPHLARLGAWRERNDDPPHDDESYLRRMLANSGAVHEKTEKALESL